MSKDQPPRIQKINAVALALGVLLSALSIINVIALFRMDRVSDDAHVYHYACIDASNSLMSASDYLTSEARMYVMTGDTTYANNYLYEVEVTQRREKAIAVLSDDTRHREALDDLTAALNESFSLSETELYAMRLAADGHGGDNVPEAIASTELGAEDAALSSEEKQQRAQDLVLGQKYQQSKDTISRNVSNCTNALIAEIREGEEAIDAQRAALLFTLGFMVLALVLLMAYMAYANLQLVVRPMRDHVKSIDEGRPLKSTGALEVRRMVNSYNIMYAENNRKATQLEHEAHTDALTGLLNRGYYDHVLHQHPADIALVLMDLDNFKEINDTYGHAAGDAVLKRVAERIAENFRATDFACRIGGDEFAVVMTKANAVENSTITYKLAMISDEVGEKLDGVPATTISAGVAFSRDLEAGKDIYRAADQALYQAKESGRDRVCFYAA
ncbi:MAG: diguanylate cyclase [Coriobacteriales bacterium]|nr:diguanylate cyclase [Coriobacteriales bacterium]